MNQRVSTFLAIAFLLVTVAAVASTIRLNVYIRDTAPRDAAQEQCDAETLDMIRDWVDVRGKRDLVERMRDDAVAKFLDETADTQSPTVGQLTELRAAIDAYQGAWASGDLNFRTEPLPDCGHDE